MAPDSGEMTVEWVLLEELAIPERLLGNVVWKCICVEGHKDGEFLRYCVHLAVSVVFSLHYAFAQECSLLIDQCPDVPIPECNRVVLES